MPGATVRNILIAVLVSTGCLLEFKPVFAATLQVNTERWAVISRLRTLLRGDRGSEKNPLKSSRKTFLDG